MEERSFWNSFTFTSNSVPHSPPFLPQIHLHIHLQLPPIHLQFTSIFTSIFSNSAGAQYRTFFVNLVTQDSGYMFQRLGNVKVNIKGNLTELRGILDKELGSNEHLKNRRYIFVDNDFNNIEESREGQTLVQGVYMSNIKIKIIA